MHIETIPTTAKSHPTGDRTIRLADIPETTRIRAARQLIDKATTIDEVLRLIELAITPGNAGGRIAMIEEAA